MAEQVRLFLFAGAAEPDDPLDPLTPIVSCFPASVEIIDARRLGDVSERTAARMFRPGVDAAIHDLTDFTAFRESRAASLRSAAAVLISAGRHHEPSPVSTTGRWKTPAPMENLAPKGAVLVAVDANAPGAARSVSRPVDLPASDRRAGVVFAGETAALYAALLALERGDWKGKVTLLAGDDVALADLEGYVALFGQEATAIVLRGDSRKARAVIAARAERVIDLNPLAWPGLTDVMVAGIAAGASANRIEGPLDALPDLIADALRRTDSAQHKVDTPERVAGEVLSAALVARRNFAAFRRAS